MNFLAKKYKARLALTEADVIRCQQLRYLTFISERGLDQNEQLAGLDRDDLDADCNHVMVEETRTGKLVCCFRMLHLNGGSEIVGCYSAKYYDLSRLATYPGQMVEMGRFCVHPAHRDPAILRAAWAEMSGFVDRNGVELLFGCSSFHGVDADAYLDAFALLKEKHLAPKRWLPRVKAPNVFRFAQMLKLMQPNLKLALRRMPPLLRSYLMMGGWVSDHAVVDNNLNTLHVFTGVEISQVPPMRARLMRRVGM